MEVLDLPWRYTLRISRLFPRLPIFFKREWIRNWSFLVEFAVTGSLITKFALPSQRRTGRTISLFRGTRGINDPVFLTFFASLNLRINGAFPTGSEVDHLINSQRRNLIGAGMGRLPVFYLADAVSGKTFPSLSMRPKFGGFRISCSVEIVMGLEEEFGISVEEESAQHITTVQDAANLIQELVVKSGV